MEEINEQRYYTINQVALLTGKSDRTIQRFCKSQGITKKNGQYLIKGSLIKEHFETDSNYQRKLKDAIELVTIEMARQELQYRVFTREEYDDIVGKLALVDAQNEQIEYLRNRVERQDAVLMDLAKSIRERNYIEASDKGVK